MPLFTMRLVTGLSPKQSAPSVSLPKLSPTFTNCRPSTPLRSRSSLSFARAAWGRRPGVTDVYVAKNTVVFLKGGALFAVTDLKTGDNVSLATSVTDVAIAENTIAFRQRDALSLVTDLKNGVSVPVARGVTDYKLGKD